MAGSGKPPKKVKGRSKKRAGVVHAIDCDMDEDCTCGPQLTSGEVVAGARFEFRTDPADPDFAILTVRIPNPSGRGRPLEILGLKNISCSGTKAIDALKAFSKAFIKAFES